MSKVNRQKKSELREHRQEEEGKKIMQIIAICLVALTIIGIICFSLWF